MATGPQQKRKELREKRLKAESSASGSDRRQNMTKIIGAAVGIVVIAIVVVVFAIGGNSDSDTPKVGGSEGIDKMLDGIPQEGTVLGDPSAKVTLVEFSDLQCPACAQYAAQVIPDIISGPVKNGVAMFDNQQWTILGEQSVLAAKGAFAAAEQNRYWQFIENFYANQGQENSNYVTDDYLTGIAESAGVPDLDKWDKDRQDEERWNVKLAETDDEASTLGFSGTPSFGIRTGDGPIEPIQDTTTAESIIKAIKAAAEKAK